MGHSIIIIEHTGITKEEKLRIRRFLRKMKKEREESGAECLDYIVGKGGEDYTLAPHVSKTSKQT